MGIMIALLSGVLMFSLIESGRVNTMLIANHDLEADALTVQGLSLIHI